MVVYSGLIFPNHVFKTLPIQPMELLFHQNLAAIKFWVLLLQPGNFKNMAFYCSWPVDKCRIVYQVYPQSFPCFSISPIYYFGPHVSFCFAIPLHLGMSTWLWGIKRNGVIPLFYLNFWNKSLCGSYHNMRKPLPQNWGNSFSRPPSLKFDTIKVNQFTGPLKPAPPLLHSKVRQLVRKHSPPQLTKAIWHDSHDNRQYKNDKLTHNFHIPKFF